MLAEPNIESGADIEVCGMWTDEAMSILKCNEELELILPSAASFIEMIFKSLSAESDNKSGTYSVSSRLSSIHKAQSRSESVALRQLSDE
jgi:hypothetical protein